MSRIETQPIQRNPSYLNSQATLGLLLIATLGKLIIEIPRSRPVNRVRITKDGVVLFENGKTKKRLFEIQDDHSGIININGLNWLFRDRTSSQDGIKGEIRIGGKMAKHGNRIHMRKGKRFEITEKYRELVRDEIKVKFV